MGKRIKDYNNFGHDDAWNYSHPELENLPAMENLREWCHPEWTTGIGNFRQGIRMLQLDIPEGVDIITLFYYFHSQGPQKGSVNVNNRHVCDFNPEHREYWDYAINEVNTYTLSKRINNANYGKKNLAKELKDTYSGVYVIPNVIKAMLSGLSEIPLVELLSGESDFYIKTGIRDTAKDYIIKHSFKEKSFNFLIKYFDENPDQKLALKIRDEYPDLWEKLLHRSDSQFLLTITDLYKYGF